MQTVPTGYTLRASSDLVKRDLELTCDSCDEHLCDAEDGDALDVLASVADDHYRATGHGG